MKFEWLWWLIFYVNLTGPQHAQIFGQTFWGYLWGCSWMRLTFESVDWVKQTALPDAGGPRPISWRSGQHKKADSPVSKRELLLDNLSAGVGLFLPDELDEAYPHWGGRAIGLIQPTHSNAHLFRKPPHRHTRKWFWTKHWAPSDPIRLTYKGNNHVLEFQKMSDFRVVIYKLLPVF